MIWYLSFGGWHDIQVWWQNQRGEIWKQREVSGVTGSEGCGWQCNSWDVHVYYWGWRTTILTTNLSNDTPTKTIIPSILSKPHLFWQWALWVPQSKTTLPMPHWCHKCTPPCSEACIQSQPSPPAAMKHLPSTPTGWPSQCRWTQGASVQLEWNNNMNLNYQK